MFNAEWRQRPWHKLITLLRQAASGILHLHEVPMIHRDLAARNLLVDETLATCVVADFGLSDLKKRVTGKTQGDGAAGPTQWSASTALVRGPVRWMAPESLSSKHEQQYTTATDVFSFGLVMYEVLCHRQPYDHLLSPHDIPFFVCDHGGRVALPAWTPSPLQSCIQTMWAADPSQRPTMHTVLSNLEKYETSCALAEDPRPLTRALGAEGCSLVPGKGWPFGACSVCAKQAAGGAASASPRASTAAGSQSNSRASPPATQYDAMPVYNNYGLPARKLPAGAARFSTKK